MWAWPKIKEGFVFYPTRGLAPDQRFFHPGPKEDNHHKVEEETNNSLNILRKKIYHYLKHKAFLFIYNRGLHQLIDFTVHI